jgi:hypothetical protein
MNMQFQLSELNKLYRRLEKLNIYINLAINFPWVYLTSVNGHVVKEKYKSEHGFVISMIPNDVCSVAQITNISATFDVIRNTLCNEVKEN